MMFVPLSGTMSLLFSPFGERAWVGPGIWVSKTLNRYTVLSLARKKNNRNEVNATKVPHLLGSFPLSAYSSQISLPWWRRGSLYHVTDGAGYFSTTNYIDQWCAKKQHDWLFRCRSPLGQMFEDNTQSHGWYESKPASPLHHKRQTQRERCWWKDK